MLYMITNYFSGNAKSLGCIYEEAEFEFIHTFLKNLVLILQNLLLHIKKYCVLSFSWFVRRIKVNKHLSMRDRRSCNLVN